MIRRRLLLSGRVQGIGFRYSFRRVAESAGVSGWCRNLDDGRVEAAVEGEADAVERVVTWARKGPSRAVVTQVDVMEEPPTGETGFRLS
ncbi:MAG: acylphosphatase [Acidimicrobiia bacterium]